MLPLISPQELSTKLTENVKAPAETTEPCSYVILDCRFNLMQPDQGEQAYAAAHLPGAIYVHLDRDLAAPVQEHGGRHPLPSPTALTNLFTRLGIVRGQTDVIVYDSSRFAFAARVWWLLRYCGHDRVFILDGGFPAWTALGLPVESGAIADCEQPSPPTPELTPQILAQPDLPTFQAQLQTDWVVSREQLLECQTNPAIQVIDAREPARYRGEVEPIDPFAGHIPGALNYPWQTITDGDGWAIAPEHHWQRWQNFPACDAVVAYCGSGVTACVVLLSLAIAQHYQAEHHLTPPLPQGKLYAGSWSDWCSYITDAQSEQIARVDRLISMH